MRAIITQINALCVYVYAKYLTPRYNIYPLLLSKSNIIMIISPHVDDECIGCGVLIDQAVKMNKKVYVVYITNGNNSRINLKNLAEIRKSEAELVKNKLKYHEHFFLDIDDGHVKENRSVLNAALENIINEITPNIIFSPSLFDRHEDHFYTTLQIMEILRSKKIELYQYAGEQPFTSGEVTHYLKGNGDIKKTLYKLFDSQGLNFNSLYKFEKYRSKAICGEFAELYKFIAKESYSEIINFATNNRNVLDKAKSICSTLKMANNYYLREKLFKSKL